MKVFVAGASGAIGQPLLRQLVAAGHEVTGHDAAAGARRGDPRRRSQRRRLRRLRRPPLEEAVEEAAPEVVVNQLTSLPAGLQPAQASTTGRPTGCARRGAAT